MNIIDAIRDDAVFGRHFRGPTWDAWRVFLAALFALPMTPEQLAIYQQHTGRTSPPTTPSHEAWLVIGRRGGKSFILAMIAVFLACFFDWRPYLGPGEVGTIMVVCADRRQARTIMRYALGLLRAVPMLKRQIEGVTRETISLKGNVVIEIHTASFRTTRGYSIVAALLDELAYWEVDENSASPDVEVINAIKPGMATIPEAMLLCASSPHARRGALWEAHKKHFGRDDDPVLVWQAPTRAMNSSVPQSFIDQHLTDDPARAAAEYMAEFRIDIEGFVSLEAVEGCIGNYRELPPAQVFSYYAFVDPSGGSGDSFTLAITHREGEDIFIDAVRERRPPFSPEDVIVEFSKLCSSYRVNKVVGDRFGGEFPRELFQKQGLLYEPASVPKSDLFRDLLPLLNSGRIILPRNDRLISQIVGLERKVGRSGRDSIDHAPHGHDDLANAVAGAADCARSYGGYDTFYRAWNDDNEPGSWRQFATAMYLQSGGMYRPPFFGWVR